MSTPWITTTELTEKIGTSAATARGTAAIAAACDVVRLATEQEIYPAVSGGTAILDGTGTDSLLLPQRPVTGAGTVIESSGTLTLNSDYVLSDDGTLFRKPGVIDTGWGTDELRTYWWPGRQNIVVTYDYGYTTATLPGELKEVALEIASRIFDQTSGNVIFESQGQRSIRYAGPAGELTSIEAMILRKHKQAK